MQITSDRIAENVKKYNDPAGQKQDLNNMLLIGCHEPRFDRNLLHNSTFVHALMDTEANT